MPESPLVTPAKYARDRGLSKAAVSKAIKERRISLVGKKLDPVAADAAWAKNTRHKVRKGGPRPVPAPEEPAGTVAAPPAPRISLHAAAVNADELDAETLPDIPTDDLNAARAVKEAYQAYQERLKYLERRGKLVSAEKVRTEAFNAARRARDLLLTIPDRLASILAGETDAAECKRVMEEEIRHACDELSRGPITRG